MTDILFSRIAIIGLGLIGSSIARAACGRNLARIVIGCDANEILLAYARKHQFIDVAASDAAEAVDGCQLVILAAPPSALADLAKAIAPRLEKGAIIMDVCSVKQAAIDAIAPHLPPGVDFVPAHPVAGSEQSGAAAGRGDLFERRQVIVTPEKPMQSSALQAATVFWQALGARVEAMPPAMHDLVYAHVSHLPHLLAFAAAKPLAAYRDDENLQAFLRLSRSNPAMWAEIFSLNKDNVLAALDRYLDAVSHVAGELDRREAELAMPYQLMPPPQPSPYGGGSSAEFSIATYTTLFPRIAASCLITTVMQAERNAGFPFARYAGTGFADFTSPAAQPPENDIERISGQYQAVAGVLAAYIERLKAIRAALSEDGDVHDIIIP